MSVTLFIETSNKYLSVGIEKNNELVYKLQYEAWQRQSEFTMKEVEKAFRETKINTAELTGIVVSRGPGSYTGLRIALTIGKVLGYALHVPVMGLSSLQVLAGKQKNALAIMDARSGRAYVGHYNEGVEVTPDCIMTIDEIKEELKNNPQLKVVGDGSLIGVNCEEVDIIENMFNLVEKGIFEEDVNKIKPQYLKD